jgi:hypothetical protein
MQICHQVLLHHVQILILGVDSCVEKQQRRFHLCPILQLGTVFTVTARVRTLLRERSECIVIHQSAASAGASCESRENTCTQAMRSPSQAYALVTPCDEGTRRWRVVTTNELTLDSCVLASTALGVAFAFSNENMAAQSHANRETHECAQPTKRQQSSTRIVCVRTCERSCTLPKATTNREISKVYR